MELDLKRHLPSTVTITARAELTTGQHHRRVTHFPSNKNKSAVGCAVLQHSDFCIHLEYDPRVTGYCSRPGKIRFESSNQCYSPDFCALFEEGHMVFYELLKPASVILQVEKDRQSGLRELFGEAGLTLEIITLASISQSPKTDNLKLLYHHALHGTSEGAHRVVGTITDSGSDELSVRHLLSSGYLPEDIAYSIFYKMTSVNLSQPFNLDSRVRNS
ncbi:hypothetical protein I8746_20105 [Pseudomonas sp. USTB-Z]|uniref:hypothetical protein n=1 Tax=unclassified Pseudomonas TaxID=196821 RepID=UPI001C8316A7|nr:MULTISPECIES: hypothetical protein [unclassified Pseudomonas]MBX6691907.1 hypothetical protein [Pseudomonas sp. USTB-Z]MDH0707783.1 hypothetical protein [Pseudomonas sp. GD03862]